MKFAIYIALVIWVCLGNGAIPSAQRSLAIGQEQRSEPLKIVRIYADASGETHMQTLELQLDTPSARSEILRGPGNVQFQRFAPDLHASWHSSDRRKYLVTLSGAGYEVEVTDGTKMQFPQGTILLADDMKSKGHRAKGLGTESLIMYVETDDLPR